MGTDRACFIHPGVLALNTRSEKPLSFSYGSMVASISSAIRQGTEGIFPNRVMWRRATEMKGHVLRLNASWKADTTPSTSSKEGVSP